MNNEFYSYNEDEQKEIVEQELIARNIVKSGDFTETFNKLREENLLTQQTERVKELYKKQLETANFLTEKDWELLTFIDLYSPDLTTHCIETYQLAHSKIEQIHIGSETLAQLINKESVSTEEFYRACLLHDIGKTLIPESILNRVSLPGDWLAISRMSPDDPLREEVFERLELDNSNDVEDITITSRMKKLDLYPNNTVPIRELISEDEAIELERRGISSDRTFREVIEMHELASQEILNDSGLNIEAAIAGQHHNYRREDYHFPINSQTIAITADLSDLLHLADVEQSLLSKRPYKKPFSHMKAFEILINDAERGTINKKITALWVENGLQKEPTPIDSEENTKMITHIQLFLNQYCPES